MHRKAARPAQPLAGPAPVAGNPLRAVLRGGSGAQAKLEVGSPADPREAEADRMADRVMRMPAATGRLLAHELTHVTQQGDASRAVIRRWPVLPAPAPFSVDTGVFQTRLDRGVELLKGKGVVMNTAAGLLEPALRAMAANVEWRDSTGLYSMGGASAAFALPGGSRRTVRLRLIVDDAVLDPPLAGRFEPSGATSAAIRVFMRSKSNETANGLGETLYHEALHMVSWFRANAPSGGLAAEIGATEGQRAVISGIDPAQHPRYFADVRQRVDRLATSVNVARSPSDQVSSSQVDRVANFMLEEYLVRIESRVFELFLNADIDNRASYLTGTAQLGLPSDPVFPRNDVDNYLFEFNGVFRASDRSALSGFEQRQITELANYFNERVKHLVGLRYKSQLHGRSPKLYPNVDTREPPPKRSFIPNLIRSVDEIP